MKHSIIVKSSIITLLFAICTSCEVPKQTAVKPTAIAQSDFIASVSQVWADTINPNRKVTLANINTSNMFIGTDERYGEEGIINLQGVTKNFELNWTVLIKIKQTDFPKRYIAYKGTLTDTSSNHKRMVAYSPLDTLYLKALPPPSKK